MNSNQQSQVEKIRKIHQVNHGLERKKELLSKQILANKEKMKKIITFLNKQGISEEEISSYLQELETTDEVSPSPEISEFGH